MRLALLWAAGAASLVAAILGGYWFGRRAPRQAASSGVGWTVIIVGLIAVGATAVLVGGWPGEKPGPGLGMRPVAQKPGGPAATGPVVTVKTAPLRKATITETITAYGTVVSEAGEVEVVSVPYEARVRRVQAAPGQRVAAGSALLEVAPSAGTALQLRQARASVDAAAKQLRETEERYRANLATNQELFAAEANLRSGRAGLEGLEKGGAGAPQRLTTGVSGIVSILNVRVGQTVPAGNALLEIVSEDHIEVQLGVEPEALPRLRVGQPVTLSSVHSGSPANVPGKIRLVTQRVNPATRLVDVFVSTPQGTDLLLGAYVRGTLTTASKGALVVPREAALPEGQEHVLFSVKDQRAVKHVVALGLENDREVEVLGSDLQAGQEVVVSGNYELRDGMAVTLETASPAMRTPAVSPAPKADP